jgi:hypothetical protein
VCSVEQGQSLNKTSKERNGIQNREATKAAAPAGRYPHPLGHRPASGQCRPSAPRPPPSSRRPLPTSSPVKRLPVVVSLANTTELLMHPCGLSWRFLQPLCHTFPCRDRRPEARMVRLVSARQPALRQGCFVRW